VTQHQETFLVARRSAHSLFVVMVFFKLVLEKNAMQEVKTPTPQSMAAPLFVLLTDVVKH